MLRNVHKFLRLSIANYDLNFRKHTIITQILKLPEKIHTILWWHISVITCQIIMSTYQISMSTRQLFMSTCQILCRPGGCDPASNCQLPNCRCFLDSAVPTSEGDMVTMMKSKNIYLSLKSLDSLRAGTLI